MGDIAANIADAPIVKELDKEFQEQASKTPEFMASASLIDPGAYYDKPPVVLSIQGVAYGTLGNISMISGKPKSKKSMLLALITAAVLGSESISKMQGEIPSKLALYFDTEQGYFHAGMHAKRINSLLSDKYSEKYLKYRALRRYSPCERIKIIEWVLYNTKNIGLVIIDGIADLLNKGVNDEEEAIAITNTLMKWSEELNVHIVTVLHQNKGDNNAKGHIGSQLNQKCETVLSVERDPENKAISKIEPTQSRGIDIDPFYISINNTGIPEIINENCVSRGAVKKSKDPHGYSEEFHDEVLKQTFAAEPDGLMYSALIDKLRHVLKKKELSVGDKKARDWRTYYLYENFIFQNGKQYKLISKR